MPTRSFGDFYLKDERFFHPYRNREFGYRQKFKKYTGPYITHQPDIKVHQITKADEYLILASDGLWDEIERANTHTHITSEDVTQEQIAQRLFKVA